MTTTRGLFLAFALTACSEGLVAADPEVAPPVATPEPSASSSSGGPADASVGRDASPDATVEEPRDAGLDAMPNPATPVRVRLLTYNIAGLPQGVSGSNPAVNTPLISPLLEPFDLVLVQEDFTYHAQLIANVTHPHRSETVALADRSDGLNQLSRAPFSAFTRTPWTQCNGLFDQANDCLTKKGFTRSVLDFGAGRLVDVYNVHFDAGRSEGDQAARKSQADQLAATIAQTSQGHAVVVAGDTNMRAVDESTFTAFLAETGLTCACRTLECPEPARIDRVLLRSGTSVTVTPLTYALAPGFVDPTGAPLSDHEPIHVDIEVR